MPKTIELCVYDSLFQKRAAIDPTLLKSVIARDESLKIEVADNVETVFAFDDEHHEWSPILNLNEDYPAISARPILAHPYAYYKLTEVADGASACLYSEGNLLYIPGYGMLVDPEENKHIEATPEALGVLLQQGVGVKEAINQLQEGKIPVSEEISSSPEQDIQQQEQAIADTIEVLEALEPEIIAQETTLVNINVPEQSIVHETLEATQAYVPAQTIVDETVVSPQNETPEPGFNNNKPSFKTILIIAALAAIAVVIYLMVK